jgi:spermidine synthase
LERRILLKLLRGRRSRRSSVEVSEEGGFRSLHLGGDAVQSAMKLSDPSALALDYTRAMMGGLLFVPAPRDILMIGLGGGSIARFVHERLPDTRMTAVELNAQVVAAARGMFGLPADDERLAVVVADGADYVPAHPRCCDLLLLDAFEDGVSVAALATADFYAACREALRPGGALVVNFIAEERHFAKYLARIASTFGGRVLCLPAENRVNVIVMGLAGPRSRYAIDALKREARALKRRLGLPFDTFVRDLVAFNPHTAAYLTLGEVRDPRPHLY